MREAGDLAGAKEALYYPKTQLNDALIASYVRLEGKNDWKSLKLESPVAS